MSSKISDSLSKYDFKNACELYSSGEDIENWIPVTLIGRPHDGIQETTVMVVNILDFLDYAREKSKNDQYYHTFVRYAYEYASTKGNLFDDSIMSDYHKSTVLLMKSDRTKRTHHIMDVFELPYCICNIMTEFSF
jgi:hypothetical protein